MKNKSQTYKKLDSDIKKFLRKNRWKIYAQNSSEYFSYLFCGGITELPYKPKFLIEKDKQKMWVYYFWKGDYPYWQCKGGQITGFDWYKYQMMKGLTRNSGLPCAVLFDSEQQPEIIFRQLDQLPPPKHSRFKRENCRRALEPFQIMKAKCFDCWIDNPITWKMCKKQKLKMKSGMAVWSKDQFGHDTVTQPNLLI